MLNYFNLKAKKAIRTGLLAAFVTVPAVNAEARVHYVDINNDTDVTNFTKSRAESFLRGYKVQRSSVLSKYASCTPKTTMQINVKSKEEPVKYDFDNYNVVSLEKLLLDAGYDTGKDAEVTLGITSRSIAMAFDYKADISIYSGGYFCFSIANLNVTNELFQTVMIASDIKDQTCNHRETLGHENRHVFFNKSSFSAYDNISDEFYKKALAPINGIKIPVNISDKEYRVLLNAVSDYINSSVLAIRNSLIETANGLNDQIDTAAAYDDFDKSTVKKCGGTPVITQQRFSELHKLRGVK